jgi:hypothetical protein
MAMILGTFSFIRTTIQICIRISDIPLYAGHDLMAINTGVLSF